MSKKPKAPKKIEPPASPMQERLKELQTLIPWAFADGALDVDAIKQLTGAEVAAPENRYRFQWAGAKESYKALRVPAAGALVPRREDSVDFDNTKNLYIEGDNLEVLKLLQRAYAGRVKMIYIDPPYNTGNDFVYADNFRDPLAQYLRETGQVDENGNAISASARKVERKLNGHRHSKWMAMMFPRLFMARSFLCEDGVIFVSIDDNEVHHLRMLMNLVFGEESFIGQLIHQRAKGGGRAEHIVKGHDYILVYAKHKSDDTKLRRKKIVQGKIVEKDGKKYIVDNDVVRKVYGKYDKSLGDRRCYYEELLKYKTQAQKKKIDAGIASGELFLMPAPSDSSKHIICKLIPLDDARSKFYSIIKVLSEKGNDDLDELNIVGFDNPKPVELIKQLADSIMGTDSIVMDFFSGSSTTAHAVMQLNAEDGGQRRCISVQMAEPTSENSEARKAGYENIAQIGRERIRRAGEKIRESENDNKTDIGFRAFALEQSAFKQWRGTSEATTESLIETMKEFEDLIHDGVDEDALLHEILPMVALPLTAKKEKLKIGKHTVWKITDDIAEKKPVYVCLDRKLTDDLHIQLRLSPQDTIIVRDSALTNSMATGMAGQCDLMTI